MARDRGTAALAPTVGPESAATQRLRVPPAGPHDADTLDPDFTPAAGTLDFGAVRVPVPADGTVALEPSSEGRTQAVHVTVAEGRLSVSALAAPRNGGLWPDLATEIDASLREGGARVRSFTGAWGRELHATTDGATSVFVGVDGPRWMLYGVATGPTRDAVALDARLRRMLRGTVVVRGRAPYPVRTVLPLVAPSAVDTDHPETPSVAPTMTLRTPPASIGAGSSGAGSSGAGSSGAGSSGAGSIGAVTTGTDVADATPASRPSDSGVPRAIGAGVKTNGAPHAPAAFHGAGVNEGPANGAAAAAHGAGTNRAGANGAGANGAVANGAVTNGGFTNGGFTNGGIANGAVTNGRFTNGVRPSGAYPTGVPHGAPDGAVPFGAATSGMTPPGTYPPAPGLFGARPEAGGGRGASQNGVSGHGAFPQGANGHGVAPSGGARNAAATGGGYPIGPAAYGAPGAGAVPAGAATSGGYRIGPAAYGAPGASAGPAGAATGGGYPTGGINYGATNGAPSSGAATNGSNPYGAATNGSNPYGAATNGANPYGASSPGDGPRGGAPNGRALDPGVGSGEWSSVRPPGDLPTGDRTAADGSGRPALPARWAHQSGRDARSAGLGDQRSAAASSSTAISASPSVSGLPWASSDTAAAASTSSSSAGHSVPPPDRSDRPATPTIPATPVGPVSQGRASWADPDPFGSEPDATSFRSSQWDPLFDPLPAGLDPLPDPVPRWSDDAPAQPDERRPTEPVGSDAPSRAGTPLFDGTVSASGALRRAAEPRLDDGPDVGTPLFDDAASASGGWASTSGGWALTSHPAGRLAAEPGGRRRRESHGQDLPPEHSAQPRARRYRGEPGEAPVNPPAQAPVAHAPFAQAPSAQAPSAQAPSAQAPVAPSPVSQPPVAPTADATIQRPGRRRAPETPTTSLGRHEAGATPARHRDDAHPRHADAGSRHAAPPGSSRVPPTQWAWPKEPAHSDAEPQTPTGRRAADDAAGPTTWSAAELLDTRGNGGRRRRSETARHGHPADPEAGRHQRP